MACARSNSRFARNALDSALLQILLSEVVKPRRLTPDGARRIAEYSEVAKLVDNATLSAPLWLDFDNNSVRPTMGGAGRVVGNLIRAGTCRLCGAAWDNGPVCSVATGEPATVSALRKTFWRDRCQRY